jgi:predicted ATP-dependent endonuclease of OLD family
MAIEEPELYLHPHGCRHFYKLLCELSRNGVQIVYTTHERSLVNVIDYQNVHLVRKRNGKTYARSGIELSLPPSETIKIASKFDDMMNEIFFANRVILVEGFADRIAAQLALEKEDTDIDKENISITECGGRGAIKDIATIIKHFDIPVYIIVDEDPQNPIAQRENQGLISLVGKDNVFLQRPNLEGVFGLQKKPKKNEALNIFPSWFEQNEIPQLYMDLKERIFGG